MTDADSSSLADTIAFNFDVAGSNLSLTLRHVGAGRVVAEPGAQGNLVAELFVGLTADDVDRLVDAMDEGVAEVASGRFRLRIDGATCSVESTTGDMSGDTISLGKAELHNRLDEFRVFLSCCTGDVVDLTLTEYGIPYVYRIARRTAGYCELVSSRADGGVAWDFVTDLQSIDDADFFLDRLLLVVSGAAATERTGTNICSLEIEAETSWLRHIWDDSRGVPISTPELRSQLVRLREFLRLAE